MSSGDYYSTKWPSAIATRYVPTNYQSPTKQRIILESVEEPRYTSSPFLSRPQAQPQPPPRPFSGYRPFWYIDRQPPVQPLKALPPIADPTVNTTVNTTTTTTTTTQDAAVVAPKPFSNRTFRILGYIISVLAVLAFALEIANLAVAFQSAPDVLVRNCNPTFGFAVIPWFFTWVAPGIWASIPIFVSGLLAIYLNDYYGSMFRALAIFSSLSAFFFAPAIIAISGAEEGEFLNYCSFTLNMTSTESNSIKAKLIIPIILIIIGIVLFILLLYLTIVLCCSYEDVTVVESVVVANKDSETKTVTPAPAPAPVAPVPVAPAPVIPTPVAPVPVPVIPVPTIPLPAPTIPRPILVPIEQETLPPQTGYFIGGGGGGAGGVGGVGGRVVFMEAHNRGVAYSDLPGYFTTLPTQSSTTTIAKPSYNTGYYWN